MEALLEERGESLLEELEGPPEAWTKRAIDCACDIREGLKLKDLVTMAIYKYELALFDWDSLANECERSIILKRGAAGDVEGDITWTLMA